MKVKEKLLNTTSVSLAFIILIGITVAVIGLPTCRIECETEGYSAEKELADVQLAMAAMMEEAVPPIENFETDPRVEGFVNCNDGNVVTRNMKDGGLINIKEPYILGGSIRPLSEYLEYVHGERTEFWYCVETDGAVHSYYDGEGKEEILV